MDELFLNVSDWTPSIRQGTLGARPKRILEAPNGNTYLFKQAKNDGYLRYEFWYEVLASQFGHWLGFDIVNYQLAVFGQEIGSLCLLFTDETGKQVKTLMHAYQLLNQYSDSFEAFQKRPVHTIEQIEQAMDKLKVENWKKPFAEMLVFDALVGNTDRHTENWGLLIRAKSKSIQHESYEKNQKENEIDIGFSFQFDITKTITPIYDISTCFGHELDVNKTIRLLGSDTEFDKYIAKGTQEILLNNTSKKQNHFLFIENLLQNESWRPFLTQVAYRVLNIGFPEKKLTTLLNKWSAPPPINPESLALSLQQKNLILRLAKRRWKLLQNLF